MSPYCSPYFVISLQLHAVPGKVAKTRTEDGHKQDT